MCFTTLRLPNNFLGVRSDSTDQPNHVHCLRALCQLGCDDGQSRAIAYTYHIQMQSKQVRMALANSLQQFDGESTIAEYVWKVC